MTTDEEKVLAHELAAVLQAAAFYDDKYEPRALLVRRASELARRLGWKTGYRIDPKEPDWPVLFIELPTGQVSWHMPQHELQWDGHTTTEKHDRIARFVEDHFL